MSEKGRPLPKFGEWDVNDPASAEGFTVIFNKARDEKKTGGKPDSPAKADSNLKNGEDPVKPPAVSCSLLIHYCTYHFSVVEYIS
ncbi:Protein NOI4 [Camellia lanceoleosa]|uniref:Protein NOI4 n=1 Tax=Camellia lanceoleosa TaxID=1840588 RepID=A0ACC0HCD3_9ERIC|nr:Protein NOI4 [Camellia lanceoleosa]